MKCVPPDERRVLSLGAGVQSSLLYLWAIDGRLRIDAAIFADTGDEPAPVYEHLAWLEGLGGPKILRRGLPSSISDNLLRGVNSTGGRFVTIPAYTRGQKNAVQRRQCTNEYKLRVIGRTIRRELLGLPPRRSIPRGVRVVQVIGFSAEESGRAERMLRRQVSGWGAEFPLIEAGLSRSDCEAVLRERVPHKVMRSACVFCPYRSNAEWRELRDRDPEGYAKAIRVDEALRSPATADSRGGIDAAFVHRSRVPLPLAVLESDSLPLFFSDCVGGCGT